MQIKGSEMSGKGAGHGLKKVRSGRNAGQPRV